MVRRAHDVGLDAEHQLAGCLVDEGGLQPGQVLLQQILCQRREERERVEERAFRFDDTMDGEVADGEGGTHGDGPLVALAGRVP